MGWEGRGQTAAGTLERHMGNQLGLGRQASGQKPTVKWSRTKAIAPPGQEKKPREHDIQIGHVCRGLTRILQSRGYTQIDLVGPGKTASPRKSQPLLPQGPRGCLQRNTEQGGRGARFPGSVHSLSDSLGGWGWGCH